MISIDTRGVPRFIYQYLIEVIQITKMDSNSFTRDTLIQLEIVKVITVVAVSVTVRQGVASFRSRLVTSH
ncbi:hypothetical protein Lepto7375DRAFT_7302 [Leptolyngbya sp. PCC 7375]|nr:hypothetical protein Lepto7375DRAFT_7302 [Leptolyngbya sp. PCC 7375]